VQVDLQRLRLLADQVEQARVRVRADDKRRTPAELEALVLADAVALRIRHVEHDGDIRLGAPCDGLPAAERHLFLHGGGGEHVPLMGAALKLVKDLRDGGERGAVVHCLDRKSTRLNSSHVKISYAVFCLKKKNK